MPSSARPSLRELFLVLRGIARVMQDSNRIDDIHRVAEITTRGRFAAILARAHARGEPPALLRDRPVLSPRTVDLPALRTLPDETLGRAFVRHLDDHGLKMYVADVSPDHVPDPDVRYLIHRYRQVHDLWHVLLGLGTSGHEEVLVHAFVLGHMRLPVSMLVVLFGTLKHGIGERRWGMVRHAVREAYHRGREASPELLWARWEDHWGEPLDEVRRRYGVRPIAAVT